MRKIELLAPAGSKESLIAAVQNGADAVYLGGTKFSARAYASNFDKENMEWAVDYCHLYGVKVYVTMNTLIKDEEMQEALEYAQFLHNIGIDALIIQDYGLAFNLRERLPELEIHASTQMTVHNAEGAKFLHSNGFQRIVLSRELHIDEIKKISLDYNIETEMFVHGALCICYSGQCLMSSTLGGRSGNRGRCAQPCRLPYKVLDSKGNTKQGYIMSPKDVCTLEDIERIIKSGTSSLKIEGRMKRPEYVAGVVRSYRRAIDAFYENESIGKKEISLINKELMQLFNREGFSKSYLFGNIGRDMMSYGFPKNTGLFLGKVEKGGILLQESVSKGDGIRTGQGGFNVSAVIKNGAEVESAEKGDLVQFKPGKYGIGEKLYKTSDSILNRDLQESFSDAYGNKIELNPSVKFKQNEPLTMRVQFEGKEFVAEGEVVQVPIKRPLDREKVEKSLKKSGDTPFKFSKIIFESYEEGFLPISALNECRRMLVEKLENEVVSRMKNSDKLRPQLEIEKEDSHGMPHNLLVVRTSEQLKAAKKMRVENICVDLTLKCSKDISDEMLKGCYIKINNIIKDMEYQKIAERLDGLIPLVKGVITSNLGIISEFGQKTKVIADYKSNIFNKYALCFFKDHLLGAYASTELNRKEIMEISKVHGNRLGVLIFGEIELMVSQYCPVGSTFGGKREKQACSRACEKETFVLKDRMNVEFPVKTDSFCRSYIYNSVPLDVMKNKEGIESKGTVCRMDLLQENFRESEDLIKYFRGEKNLDIKATRGQFNKGIE